MIIEIEVEQYVCPVICKLATGEFLLNWDGKTEVVESWALGAVITKKFKDLYNDRDDNK